MFGCGAKRLAYGRGGLGWQPAGHGDGFSGLVEMPEL
jgi:hypothetical protein